MPAPRAQWKGFLKLSLVSCPIALYPAITDAHKIKFRQVNRRTGNRLRQQLVDTVTGETVETPDKGRGYEIGAHQFLPVEQHEVDYARAAAMAPPAPEPRGPMSPERRTPELGHEPPPQRQAVGWAPPRGRSPVADEIDEQEAQPEEPELPPAPALANEHTIELERFVPRAQIDPAYYDKAYYIVPREPVGQEAFAVVRDAMDEKGMVALGYVILSSRRRPIAVEAYGKGLRGFVLRHLHEVREPAEYFDDIPDLKLPRQMLDLAKHILETKTGDFDPSFLEDRYQQALVQILRKKQSAISVRSRPASPSQENVVSIMDALKRSLVAEREAGAKPERRPAARSLQAKRPTTRKRKAG